jgi:hypothetical protein
MRENFWLRPRPRPQLPYYILEPAKIPLWRKELRNRSHPLDTARHRKRVPAELRSLDEHFDRFGRDVGCGGRMPVERAAVRNGPKEVAIP